MCGAPSRALYDIDVVSVTGETEYGVDVFTD